LRGIADTLFKDKRIPVPVKSNDIYLGAIPWVIMQVVLVAIVIFVPQSVTMFLDEKVDIDVDKVIIDMPVDEANPAVELKAGELPETKDGMPVDPAAGDKAAEKAADEEQKKIDDLFKK
jgi:hypothetical protein